MSQLSLNTVRCEALFASTLQCSDDVDPHQVQAVIMAAVREFGSRGCAARVAREFGYHPDTAIVRMRWARGVVARLSGSAGSARTCPSSAQACPRRRPARSGGPQSGTVV